MTTPLCHHRYSPVAVYLEERIKTSGVSQTEIAELLGYDHPNVVSMFKTGRTKVPLEKIPALAEILGCSELYFMKLALEEYEPQLWMVIERVFGHLVSENEMDIIDTIRTASAGTDPEMTEEQEQAIIKLFLLTD